MRLVSQYKNFVLTNKIFSPCPLKVLKFHRTKWKKIQKVLKYSKKNSFKKIYKSKLTHLLLEFKTKNTLSSFLLKRKKSKLLFKSKKKCTFVNNLILKVFLKRWYKLKKKYSENLKLKRVVSQIFDNSIKNSLFKKEIHKKNSLKLFNKQFNSIFIKPIFKINILLTKLFFFKNVYQANQFIFSNKILLNNEPASPNQFLKKGDVISFNFLPPKILLVLKSTSRHISFFNFIEIDHYSKTIIILKDYNSLSNEDTCLVYKDYLNLKYFSDYFK